MTKQRIYKEVEASDNINTLLSTMGIISRIFMAAPYMEKEPNNNTDYQMALAYQTMSALNLLLLLRDEVKNQRFNSITAGGIFSRALVEVTANINYFSAHKDDQRLAKKYLRTSEIASNTLNSLKSNERVEISKWTRVSITKRIKQLEEDSNSLSYSIWYSYLSSYVHSDAGYMHSLPYAKSKRFMLMYTANASICLLDMMQALEKAGVLHKPFLEFANQLKVYLENKKSKKG